MKVGRFTSTRPWQSYAFINPPKNWTYSRALDIPWASLKVRSPFLRHTKYHCSFGLDLLHTYNSIVPYGPDWIIEVEDGLPRYGGGMTQKQLDFAVKHLSHKRCKTISFTSEMAYRKNIDFMSKYGLEHKKRIIYRPVHLPSLESNKKNTDLFNVIFIGNSFYRKGGYQLLKAFERSTHKDWRLHIVSNFFEDWGPKPSESQLKEVNKIKNTDGRITFSQQMSHKEIFNAISDSDVLVGVTYADPWYNSVMEAAACGVPVIASNISSIPEMVIDGETGTLLSVGDFNDATVIDRIYDSLCRYYADTELRITHGLNARKHAEKKFSIEARNKALTAIFD
jgi:glycosyltransferase involved in cell wall biosynthesis